MTEPLNGAELLARIKPRLREESTQICLRPDLLDEWEKANAELAHARAREATDTQRLAGTEAGTSSIRKLAKRVQDIEKEIDENAITFLFRALPVDRWRVLCEKHPPRKGNEYDVLTGYNRESVEDAAVRECLVDPVFDDASWAQFLDVCNPSEWAELRRTVQSVNRSETSAPKSVLASQVLAKRGSTSRRRDPGE